jgi:tRNA(Ile)-lysidine synthase
VAALPPPFAAVRRAVRDTLRAAGLGADALVLVACSGGPDSLALASQTAFVAPRLGLRAGLISIDHGLQLGSTDRAAEVATWAGKVGLAPARAVPVEVSPTGDGPEASARAARYAGLAAAAKEAGADAVLLGHTRDDQAETVLLALARGAGPRGLAGMPARRTMHGVAFLRPLLSVTRADTRATCADLGLEPWDDPHNRDPRFLRSRVRAAMPALADLLGDDAVANLARTAELVAADVALLDELADAAADAVTTGDGLSCAALAALAPAIRTRVLRSFALGLGAPGGALATTHIAALDALVTAWHGQGAVALPGDIHLVRRGGLVTRVASP